MDATRLTECIEGVIEDLGERVSDFPGPTCSDIDAVIREIKPAAKEADRLSRLKIEDPEFADFVNTVDGVLCSLESDLDDLRAANDALRTALHEALTSRKAAVAKLTELLGAAQEQEKAA